MCVFEDGILLPIGNYLDLSDTLYPLKKNYLFIFGGAALGLHCYVQAFSSCGKQGLLLMAKPGLLIVVEPPGVRSLIVVTHGFSCSGASGIFLDQG